MRIAWATDVHLDFLDRDGLRQFAHRLLEPEPDAIILSGDISVAPSLVDHLEIVAEAIRRPVYFVLGNHDFYRDGISEVRSRMRELSARSNLLRWLPAAQVVPLGDGVCLAGVDGWGDGRAGRPWDSEILLNDFFLIRELIGLSREDLVSRLRDLGDREAGLARELLGELPGDVREVVFVTHVPPFVEACWHEGAVSGEDWQPWFTCVALGGALLEVSSRNPDREFTVLCGHTHSSGFARLAPNLRVYTGAAEYGSPTIAGLIEIEPDGVTVTTRA
ncbi:MAG: metallophosphoesterase family protein [Acidobacteria bacterium]|nr:metallophosphoesterase family protein [Acidobacteriota bacterium]